MVTTISDEVLARLGQPEAERTGVVYKKEFQRWAASVGDLNPLYFDEAVAAEHGHRDVVMPPMFLSQVMSSVALLDDLRPDGIVRDGGEALPLPERRMAGGEETYFYADVYPGDVLTSQRKMVDIQAKSGRSGEFILVKWETTYRNQDGTTVARSISSMIAR